MVSKKLLQSVMSSYQLQPSFAKATKGSGARRNLLLQKLELAG